MSFEYQFDPEFLAEQKEAIEKFNSQMRKARGDTAPALAITATTGNKRKAIHAKESEATRKKRKASSEMTSDIVQRHEATFHKTLKQEALLDENGNGITGPNYLPPSQQHEDLQGE